MKNNIKLKKQLVNELIKNINENPKDWHFYYYVVINNKIGIEIWIGSIPIISLHICEPIKIKFNIIDKFRIYKAINNLKNSFILDKLNKNDNI